jgi:hypothetical protein
MAALDKAVAEIKDENARACLTIASARKAYPRDCVTDGALEKLAAYIVSLERIRDGGP